MKQTSVITRSMAQAQEHHARLTGFHAATFRLYFEDTIGESSVQRIIDQFFPGHTTWTGVGSFHGISEQPRIVELVGSISYRARVYDLAEALRIATNQSAVLVSETGCKSVMISEYLS